MRPPNYSINKTMNKIRTKHTFRFCFEINSYLPLSVCANIFDMDYVCL